MTEIDVDMAIYAIDQAVAVLATAAQNAEARGYVEANRELLLEDIDRLSDILAVVRDPATTAAPRPGSIGAKRARSSSNPHYLHPMSGMRAAPRSRVG